MSPVNQDRTVASAIVRLSNTSACLITAFTVEKIDGIHVSIYGLGPLNWIVRRVLRALLRRHLRDFLEREGKDVVQQELQNATLASEGDNLFTMLPYLVMYWTKKRTATLKYFSKCVIQESTIFDVFRQNNICDEEVKKAFFS